MVVVPLEIPVTTPADDTVPIEGTELYQIPPERLLLKVMLLPTHTLVGPVIVPAVADNITLTTLKATVVPQALVTE